MITTFSTTAARLTKGARVRVGGEVWTVVTAEAVRVNGASVRNIAFVTETDHGPVGGRDYVRGNRRYELA